MRFNKFMAHIGFSGRYFDHCIYFRFPYENSLVILFLNVDDILIASNLIKEVIRVKGELNKEFKMKNLGVVTRILY